MESVSSKRDESTRRQAEILQQIESLKSQLAQIPKAPSTPPPSGPKNLIAAPTVLAPSTPSPRKNKVRRENNRSPSRAPRPRPSPRPPLITKQPTKNNSSKPTEGKTSSNLQLKAQLHTLNEPDHEEVTVIRSEGFSEKPAPITSSRDKRVVNRDDKLAIVEDLKLGPSELKPLPDDPDFDRLEPNSGIRLSNRLLSHTALQEHLYGRYFLPPSLLYSVVRLLPNKQAYEVPVDADWLTIAVVAERGDVKVTSGPANFSKHTEEGLEESKDDEKSNKHAQGGKRKREVERENAEENPRRGKKYVHMKLVDLGILSRSSSSSASPRGTLRGDAQLNLLLFESDHYDKLLEKVEDVNGKMKNKETKIWKGGSGGAFEECYAKLREGVVIALLNPKVLKPFNNTKNPGSAAILALTPPSASAVAIIGYAQDLGKCTVRKRDGLACGSWVDRRHSHVGGKGRGEDVCEYHIQNAVQHARASRPEFSIGTSGMSTSSRRSGPVNSRGAGPNTFAPERKWGLQPDGPTRGTDGETTYVLGGHVAGSSAAAAPGSAAEKLGRESQARAKRRRERDTESSMRRLLEQGTCLGRGSSESLAMDVVKKARTLNGSSLKRPSTGHIEGPEPATSSKRKYSVDMIRGIGFDPTLIGSAREKKTLAGSDKLSKLLQSTQPKMKEPHLGPPPGKKIRSGVIPPTLRVDEDGVNTVRNSFLGSESDSELEIESPSSNREMKDGSDEDIYGS